MNGAGKLATLAGATALLLGAVLTTGAGTAGAETPSVAAPQVNDLIWQLPAPDDGGDAYWSQDPAYGAPGDALRVFDGKADGYGVRAYVAGRVATTAGHASPYMSPWVTGNLPEDQSYTVTVCLEKGGEDITCLDYGVES